MIDSQLSLLFVLPPAPEDARPERPIEIHLSCIEGLLKGSLVVTRVVLNKEGRRTRTCRATHSIVFPPFTNGPVSSHGSLCCNFLTRLRYHRLQYIAFPWNAEDDVHRGEFCSHSPRCRQEQSAFCFLQHGCYKNPGVL